MVDQSTKMIYYKLVKSIIDIANPVEIIINVILRHHGFLKSIVSDHNSLFTRTFGILLYYFFGIKEKLSTAFYL